MHTMFGVLPLPLAKPALSKAVFPLDRSQLQNQQPFPLRSTYRSYQSGNFFYPEERSSTFLRNIIGKTLWERYDVQKAVTIWYETNLTRIKTKSSPEFVAPVWASFWDKGVQIPGAWSKWWLYMWILIMELHSHHPSGA